MRSEAARVALTRPRVWVVAAAAVLLVVADHLYQHAGGSGFFAQGALDETAHITTAWLILIAGPEWIRDRYLWPVLLGSFIIDLDHVPRALGYDFLTAGTPRPYTHSVLTLVVIVGLSLLWKRHRTFLLGFAIGITLHFFRDLAEGNGSGIALLWPLSDKAFSYSHTVYFWIMVAVVVFDLIKVSASRGIRSTATWMRAASLHRDRRWR